MKKIIFVGLIFSVFVAVVFTANAAQKITLKVEKNGKGTIASNDGKINCGSDCKEVYSSGGSINLYATSAKGFTFDKWTGNACGDSIGVGISTSTEITIGQCQVSLYYNKNKTIIAVAHFKKISSSSSSSKSPSSKSYSSKSNSSLSESTNTAATIQVVSPNGGEKWKAGKSYQIKFKISNGKKGYVDILVYPEGSEANYVFNDFFDNKKFDAGIHTSNWTIPKNISPGKYRVKAYLKTLPVEGEVVSTDSSNAPFSIN